METEGHDPKHCPSMVFPSTKVLIFILSSCQCLIGDYRWSFGGNRLQIKAEARLMTDVEISLEAVALIGHQTVDAFHSLGVKQDLLLVLLENEKMRLEVWLYPLDHERRHLFTSGHTSKAPSVVRWFT